MISRILAVDIYFESQERFEIIGTIEEVKYRPRRIRILKEG